MIKNTKKIYLFVISVSIVIFLFFGCGKDDKNELDAKLGETVYFGHTVAGNSDGSTDGKELEWIVLDRDDENNNILLLSKECITSLPFEDITTEKTNSWEKSSLKNRLNEGLIDRYFSESEINRIQKVRVEDHRTLVSQSDSDSSGYDLLFCLDSDEYDAYRDLIERNCTTKEEDYGWWLRSEGIGNQAEYIGYDGEVYVGDKDDMRGIRPAVWISISGINEDH